MPRVSKKEAQRRRAVGLHASTKKLLETIIVQAGHEAIFYPKFHCELNYIEFYWAALKRYTRENCKYSFPELESTVREGMDNVGLMSIRRFAMRSKRWILAYMNGLTEEQRRYTEHVYRSHQRSGRMIECYYRMSRATLKWLR